MVDDPQIVSLESQIEFLATKTPISRSSTKFVERWVTQLSVIGKGMTLIQITRSMLMLLNFLLQPTNLQTFYVGSTIYIHRSSLVS